MITPTSTRFNINRSVLAMAYVLIEHSSQTRAKNSGCRAVNQGLEPRQCVGVCPVFTRAPLRRAGEPRRDCPTRAFPAVEGHPDVSVITTDYRQANHSEAARRLWARRMGVLPSAVPLQPRLRRNR